MENQSQVLTTAESAEFLGLKPITLAIWRHEGRGPKFCRLGRAIRYRRAELDRYIKAVETGGDCAVTR